LLATFPSIVSVQSGNGTLKKKVLRICLERGSCIADPVYVSLLTMEHSPTKHAVGEILQDRMSLHDAGGRLKEVIERRRTGRPSGVALLSHQIIDMLPEMEKLKHKLPEILGNVDAV
jgi:hypothetical protein